jgi:predicted PurR-regulated permease PerM
MALPVRDQVKYWTIAAAVFFALVWVMGDILLPFVVGGAVAYFLDPIVTRLARGRMSRLLATSLVFVAVAAVLALALLLLIPMVLTQAGQLVAAAPDILARLQEFLAQRFPDVLDAESALRQSLGGLGETLRDKGAELLNGLLGTALGLVNIVVFLIVAPVVAFYLLMDWPNLVERLDGLLPRDHAPVIRRLAGEIDGAIAGFVRGQLTVCLILAAYYGIALSLAGLQYGLVVGVLTGLISFIPYVGAIVGGALAIGLALFQFWGDPVMIGVIIAIFVAGQVAEGNFLVPNLVGRSVGLHPVWLLFALSAFGAVLGFVGMMIAVPVAAAMGVLVRFAAEQYVESPLYGGIARKRAAEERKAGKKATGD